MHVYEQHMTSPFIFISFISKKIKKDKTWTESIHNTPMRVESKNEISAWKIHLCISLRVSVVVVNNKMERRNGR